MEHSENKHVNKEQSAPKTTMYYVPQFFIICACERTRLCISIIQIISVISFLSL